jgi:hypothetical protein
MENYEAYNEVCEGPAVLKMSIHLQLQTATVRVRVASGLRHFSVADYVRT